jgi:hypothetical protein
MAMRRLAYVAGGLVAVALLLFLLGLSVARVSYFRTGGLPPFGTTREKPTAFDRSLVIGLHPIWRSRTEATHSCAVRDAVDTVARVSGLWGGRPAHRLEIDSWCEERVRLSLWGVEIGP